MKKRSYTLFYILLILTTCKEKDDRAGNNYRISDSSGVITQNISPDSKISITGLLYHRFDENKYPGTSIKSALFEKHLQYITDKHFQTVTLGEAIPLLQTGLDSARLITITIDDAFKSFFHNGYPVLKKYGLKATLFINTETVGSGDYMNWDQLREVASYGIEIGNHTHSHAYFLNYPDSVRRRNFRKDILLAQKLIQEKIGTEPAVFAYPYGEYDNQMQEVVASLGFSCAAAQHSGVISKYSDLYALPRFPMTDLYGRYDPFVEKINMNPLPVLRTIPETTIVTDNPPELTICLEENQLDMNRMQCFIQGSQCSIMKKNQNENIIRIKAETLLTNRRHLYTVTIPSKTSGKWYWFSHQWVIPGD